MSDTFERSCQHWSEAGRDGMEDFYALASVDYRYLAEALDWPAWIEDQQSVAGNRQMKLLDVACGSGKFPAALKAFGNLDAADVRAIDYALLDPSGFSIGEARKALQPPFVAGDAYETTLQGLDCPAATFDIVWATHALYAVPEPELEAALSNFLRVTKGVGFIAHASEKSHYLEFYRRYLRGFKGGQGVPYVSAEQIVRTLQLLGVEVRVEDLTYRNGAPATAEPQVEGYLQRCLFDDTISLADMRANSETGPYLETCFKDGQWGFDQSVSLCFFRA